MTDWSIWVGLQGAPPSHRSPSSRRPCGRNSVVTAQSEQRFILFCKSDVRPFHSGSRRRCVLLKAVELRSGFTDRATQEIPWLFARVFSASCSRPNMSSDKSLQATVAYSVVAAFADVSSEATQDARQLQTRRRLGCLSPIECQYT